MGAVQFPLKVKWDDGEFDEYASCEEAALNIEFLNTDLEDEIVVWDKKGRRVRLKVEACRMIICELIQE